MKQILLFLMLMYSYVLCEAQAVTITVDNQNPGWLSSKIGYGDQQTVENLTVTGFLNATDCAFIGTLIQSHSLSGSLNLESCQFVNDNGLADNKIPSNVFAFNLSSATKRLKKLNMPTNIVDYDNSWFGEYYLTVQIDSLIIGGPQLKTISSKTIPQYKSVVKHLVIREGAESLSIGLNISSSKPEKCVSLIQCSTVHLPSTIKKIDKYSFSNSPLQEINLPDNIEEIGEYAFLGCPCFKDGIVILPKSLKELKTNMFYKALPQKLYIGPNVSTIDNSYYYDNNSGGSWTSSNTGHAPVIDGSSKVDIFVFATSPVSINYGSGLSNSTIRVPQNSLDAYKAHHDWSKLNIEGFNIPNEIDIQLPEYLYIGDNIQLNEKGDRGNIIPIVWDCEYNNIVEISNNTLYCKQYGEAVLTGAYLYQDSKTEIPLKVFEHTNGIQLSQRELEVYTDDTIQVIAQTLPLGKSDGRITWESEDETLASISNNGTLTAMKPGTVYITAKSVDGSYSKDCRVTIKNKDILIQSIRINPSTKSLMIGESFQLEVEILPTNATDGLISWISTNSDVVSVTAEGLITALSEGSAQIIATTADGSNLSAICEISVEKQFIEITQIQISPSSERIPVGQSVKLNAIVTPDDATSPNVLWSSTNTSVATVSQDGYVEAVAEGEAIIIASTQDGSNLSATCKISVYNEIILISEIVLNPTNIEGDENESATINAVIIPANATNRQLRWHSSNENVAVVNEGVVKLVKKGTAIITAEALDGSNVKSECTVVVSKSAGIESIIEDKNTFVKFFNLSGHLVYQGLFADANIEPGIYIVLCNGKSIKTKIE